MMMRAAILSTSVLAATGAFGQAAGSPVVAGAAQRVLEDGAGGAQGPAVTALGAEPLVFGIRDRARLLSLGREDAAATTENGAGPTPGRWRSNESGGSGSWSDGEPRLALPVAPSISLDLGYRLVTNEDLAGDAFLAAERGLLDPAHVSHSVTIHARWHF